MFPNISEFKERLLDGGARPSLFQMEVTWPIAVPIGNVLGAPLLPFQCRLAEIPGNSANPIILKYAGREVKYSGQRTFSNLNVTIYNDAGFRVRRAIEAWQEAMNSRESNISALVSPTGDPTKGYGGTGKVNQYDLQGNVIRSYVFVDMFPVSMASIPLDWSNDAAIQDYSVEFAYQYWIPGDEYTGSVVRRAL